MKLPRTLVASLLTLALAGAAAAQQKPAQQEHHDNASRHAEKATVEQMTPGHRHEGPHIRLSATRPVTPEDERRADLLVATLRHSLEKYRDWKVAVADGYEPFLPEQKLPEHHFTNYRIGFEAAFGFDPARPTSLLYKRTTDGWELRGAMYTAPQRFSEERLDQRVPLSVTRWHQHINICLPQRDRAATADWTQFGPAGSIATEQACQDAGGRWMPRLFGWMVHVYPWESDPAKVWPH